MESLRTEWVQSVNRSLKISETHHGIKTTTNSNTSTAWSLPFSLPPLHSLVSSLCPLSLLQLAPCLLHQTASWPTHLSEQPAGECGCWDVGEEEAGSLQVVAGGLREPMGPDSGRLGSYSWVGAGCCSWLMTTRQWIRRRTPDRCSGPGGGCGGAADASLSAHGLAASAAAPPLMLLRPLSFPLPPWLLPASLVSSGEGGLLESACQGHQGEPRGEGEGGQPDVDRDGSGRSSEPAEEEEVDERPPLRGWGSMPAGRWAGCPSGAARRCGCDWEDLRGRLKALCCSSLLVKSCQSRYHCCCWCCGSAVHRCPGRGRPGPGHLQCCPPCPGRGQKQTGGVAESWEGTPGSLLCLGQVCTQSQTSWLHLNEPVEKSSQDSVGWDLLTISPWHNYIKTYLFYVKWMITEWLVGFRATITLVSYFLIYQDTIV